MNNASRAKESRRKKGAEEKKRSRRKKKRSLLLFVKLPPDMPLSTLFVLRYAIATILRFKEIFAYVRNHDTRNPLSQINARVARTRVSIDTSLPMKCIMHPAGVLHSN